MRISAGFFLMWWKSSRRNVAYMTRIFIHNGTSNFFLESFISCKNVPGTLAHINIYRTYCCEIQFRQKWKKEKYEKYISQRASICDQRMSECVLRNSGSCSGEVLCFTPPETLIDSSVPAFNLWQT